MSQPTATSTVEIRATPEHVYAVITDLDTMAQLADETTRMRWTKGTPATAGAAFRGENRNGWRRWTTTCTVTDASAGHRFAFDVRHTVVPIARWQYDIVVSGDGCAVTESTWDRRPRWFKSVAGLATGISDRDSANSAHIAATLQRLKAHAEAGGE